MWTAVSGAVARQDQLDTVANNLANADSVGFKKDQNVFREYLAAYERDNESPTIQVGPFQDKILDPLEMKDQAFVIREGSYTNFSQGGLRVTQQPLDVALDGQGFLEVSTPQGVRYTRAGSLKIGGDGKLQTSQGFPILSYQQGGTSTEPARTPAAILEPQAPIPGSPDDPAIQGRMIRVQNRADLTINESGQIFQGGQQIGRLQVVEFEKPQLLLKRGQMLYENKDPTNLKTDPPKTLVRQGAIETSNVNPIQEMTDLIKANRLFEHDMKVLKTYQDLMGKESNEVGKL
jgi:flagellar basal-body rod protein FlgG